MSDGPEPDWDDVDAALDRALDLDGAEQRAYLDGLQPALRRAVEPLLRVALADDAALAPPASLARDAARSPESSPTGVRVGAYEIVGLVGEGGMGRVYRARRADGAFDRTVALKVVRQSLTLAGADVAARLRRERAVLAALDHPNIARLIDGGETADGVPYLVTEFVDGRPITEYAAAGGLGVRARVRLFADVARAVDHAHRRFVVHRDLKPSNVFVAEADGPAGDARPRPVVLDFGIAKLLDTAEDIGGDGSAVLTQTGMRLLTPAYAAPELYEPTADVTTSADVYGLGALLYELLTGRRPHDDVPTTGLHVGRPPMTEPTRPSRAAADRDGHARPVPSRALRGDLDVICLRALHPYPERRYSSAAALADDLERYLDGRPVEARPDSLAYVAGRFVQRHRIAVAAAAVAFMGLAVGLAVALLALGSERGARAEAERASALAAETSDVLTSLFEAANPERTAGREVSARDLLDDGVRRAAAVASPPLRGSLLASLGEAYAGIGDVVTADSLFGQALALLEGDPTAAPDVVDGLRLNYALTADALDDIERARLHFQRVAEGRERGDSLGVRARGRLALRLAYEDPERGARAAEALVREAEAHGGPAVVAIALHAQVRMLNWAVEDGARALPVARRLHALQDSLSGSRHARTNLAASQLLQALYQTDRYAEAAPLADDLVRSADQVYGPRSRMAGQARLVRVGAREGVGQPGRAADDLEAAVDILGQYLPADHVDLGWWELGVSRMRRLDGDARAAELAAHRALAIAEADGSDALRARASGQLGFALAAQDRDAEARRVLREAEVLLAEPITMPESYRQSAAAMLREVRLALAALDG